ncbi:MAG: YiiX/YebB-like N1pC/P60 family cysteine hydrolase [Henriciella sp.]|uniref:YiiX/YebB-like N1pC/P60 family cysteine hydrolase n=1 Tax=Henriciella sp. TaxID=1968823 RepID=UPI003C78F528
MSAEIRPGDLVFKGASTAVWTELAARWSRGDKRWGHVGIVTEVPGTCCDPILIVHADTGTGDPGHEAAPGEIIGEVRAVPLADFLSDVDQAGLYRLDLDAAQRARLIAYAEEAATAHIPFDRGYSIDSANNLYCTELVWRALSAGLETDAIPQKSQSMGRTYIALSDLSLHELANEILAVGGHM